MKIAQVVCVYPPYKGGIGNVAMDYHRAALSAGFDSKVITPDYGNSDIGQADVIRLKPLAKYGKGAFIPSLVKILPRYDLVHFHYPFFGGAESLWLGLFLKKNNPKLILHYHMDTEGLSLPAKVLSLPDKLVKRSLLKRAEIITCASLDYIYCSRAGDFYRGKKDKFREIPFWVDTDFFKPGTEVKTKSVLFVGGLDRAHYFKGINVLLKASANLPDFHFKIVGEGDLRPLYEKKAIELGLKNIEFAGKLNDRELVSAYQKSGVTVLPSINKHEAFGKVLLESMSCATPVIASDLPGVRRVFTNGEQGFLARPKDPVDLTAKIKNILSDKEKLDKMSKSSRKLAEEKYSKKKIEKKLISIYKQVYENLPDK